MKNLIAVGCLSLLWGCHGPKPPASDWTGVARILPIVITNNEGTTRWTEAAVKAAVKDTNEYWKNTGIQFSFLPIRHMKNEELYEQRGIIEWFKLMKLSKAIATTENVYPVCLVDTIYWNNKRAAGLSTTADMPLGFQYGTSIAAGLGSNTTSKTMAHELGHAWNLRHVWSDSHDDTPSTGPNDCNPEMKCNVMSYCFPGLSCPPPPLFSPEQRTEIRRWALSASRKHVLKTDQVTSFAVLPLRRDTAPAVDSWEKWVGK